MIYPMTDERNKQMEESVEDHEPIDELMKARVRRRLKHLCVMCLRQGVMHYTEHARR